MKWISVPGWPYEVSPSGRVRRSDTKHVLKPMMTGAEGKQYETVVLCNGGLQRTVKVHRLVAEVLIGPPPAGKPFVLHKNGKRTDNRKVNLKYGSQSENMQDAKRHGSVASKLSKAQAREIRRRRKKESGRALAEEFGVSEQLVCDIHKGRRYA